MGVAITRAPHGLGPPNLAKNLAHYVPCGPFRTTAFSKSFFRKFQGLNPPLNGKEEFYRNPETKGYIIT